VRNKMIPNKQLKYARELCGWTRSYVAERVESDPRTVGRWERGNTFPSPYHRQRLCELFGKNAEELGLIKEDHRCDTGQYAGQLPLSLHQISPEECEEAQYKPVQTTRDENWFATHMPVSLRLRLLSHRNHLTRRIVILSLLVLAGTLIFSGKYVTMWVSEGMPFGRGIYFTVPVRIVPGGLWSSPLNGQEVNDVIHFGALAYPTNRGDPLIDHVNFTMGWYGGWRIACTVYPNHIDDTYKCNVSLKQLGAPGGPIQVSFDVYDKMGNVNKAPNGEHTIIYAPQVFSSL
jgi:transcriptional regulator with XRE-family HTH domain